MRIDRYKLKIALAKNKMPRKALYENPQYGLPLGTINAITSENRVGIGTAQKLAAALGCDLSELLKEE